MTNQRAKPTFLAVLWLTAALVFFVAEALAAVTVPSPYVYSYARDYISQLGVPGWTQLAVIMNAAFIAQAVLFLAGTVLAIRATTAGRRRLFVVWASLSAIGFVFVGLFHGAPTAAGGGSIALHLLGALLAILAGNAAIVSGSGVVRNLVRVRWYRAVSLTLAVFGYASFVMLGIPAARSYVGLWERGAVYTILLWQLLSAVLILTRPIAVATRRWSS